MEGCDEELIRNGEQYEEKEEPDGNTRGVCRKEQEDGGGETQDGQNHQDEETFEALNGL